MRRERMQVRIGCPAPSGHGSAKHWHRLSELGAVHDSLAVYCVTDAEANVQLVERFALEVYADPVEVTAFEVQPGDSGCRADRGPVCRIDISAEVNQAADERVGPCSRVSDDVAFQCVEVRLVGQVVASVPREVELASRGVADKLVRAGSDWVAVHVGATLDGLHGDY